MSKRVHLLGHAAIEQVKIAPDAKGILGDIAVPDDVLIVHGFASVDVEDRDGHVIDPTSFNISKFMENPQLLVNHDLWVRPDGNKVNAGVVLRAIVAQAELSADGSMIEIVDTAQGVVVDAISTSTRGCPAVGTYGLWVVCAVYEKEVQDLVREGRLNAFSWRGTYIPPMQPNGVDVWEISLVCVPANRDAMFTSVVKSAQLEDVPDGVQGRQGWEGESEAGQGSERQVATATDELVGRLRRYAHVALSGLCERPTDYSPQAASNVLRVAVYAGILPEEIVHNPSTGRQRSNSEPVKGGDPSMDQTMKTVIEGMAAVQKAVETISLRLDAMQPPEPDPAAKPEPDPTAEPAAVDPAAGGAAGSPDPAAPAPAAPADPAVADLPATEGGAVDGAVVEALNSIVGTLKSLNTRVAQLEARRLAMSAQPTEVAKTAQVTPFESLSRDQRTEALDGLLGVLMRRPSEDIRHRTEVDEDA